MFRYPHVLTWDEVVSLDSATDDVQLLCMTTVDSTLLQLGMVQAFAGDEEQAADTIRRSIIIAIANYEKASAENSLNALSSLGLESQLNQEELKLIQEKVRKL